MHDIANDGSKVQKYYGDINAICFDSDSPTKCSALPPGNSILERQRAKRLGDYN